MIILGLSYRAARTTKRSPHNIYVCMCVCKCTYVFMNRGQRSLSEPFLSITVSLIPLRQDLSLKLDCGQKPPAILLSTQRKVGERRERRKLEHTRVTEKNGAQPFSDFLCGCRDRDSGCSDCSTGTLTH